jgi:hypothetical protein
MTLQNRILRETIQARFAVWRRGWLARSWQPMLLVVLLGAGVLIVASARAAAPAASPAAEGLGTGDGEVSGTKVVITELKRGGSTVTLKFTLYNNTNAEFNVGGRFNGPDYKNNGGRSFSGLNLIDSVANKKYFVAADSDGNCLCSEHVDDMKPNTQLSLWAKFPAPPDNVQKITVQIPHFIPVDDVPIR